MALFQAKQVIAQKAIPTPIDGVNFIAITGEFTVPAGLALNDIIEMGGLPQACDPVDIIVHLPQIDTNGTPTMTLDAGLITGRFGDPVLGSRTCGNEFFAGSTTPRTGGIQRATKSLAGIVGSFQERSWGLRVSAAIATLAVGTVIRASLLVEPCPTNMTIA